MTMDEQDKPPTYEVEFVPIERRHHSRRTFTDRRSTSAQAGGTGSGTDRRESRSDRRRMARRFTDLIERPVASANPRYGK